jgi:hypothetical protein
MLSATIVHPDIKVVIPFAPEPIMKTDGANKNDCGAPRGAHKPEVKVLTRKRNPAHLELSFGLVEVTT